MPSTVAMFPFSSFIVSTGFWPNLILISASTGILTNSLLSLKVSLTLSKSSPSEVLKTLWFLFASPMKSSSIVSPMYPISEISFPLIVPPPKLMPSPFFRVPSNFNLSLFVFLLQSITFPIYKPWLFGFSLFIRSFPISPRRCPFVNLLLNIV